MQIISQPIKSIKYSRKLTNPITDKPTLMNDDTTLCYLLYYRNYTCIQSYVYHIQL